MNALQSARTRVKRASARRRSAHPWTTTGYPRRAYSLRPDPFRNREDPLHRSDHGQLEQLVVDHQQPARTLLESRDALLRPRDLLGSRRKCFMNDSKLIRMNGCLAGEAQACAALRLTL